MSVEMVIYIPLLDEGTTVVRPARAIPLSNGVFQVLAPVDYDLRDEHWEFPPGSIVECDRDMRNGKEVLVAKRRVS